MEEKIMLTEQEQDWVKYIASAADIIDDKDLRNRVTVRILSRVAAVFASRQPNQSQ